MNFFDITLKVESIKYSLNYPENAFLCMSIPYTKGWKAYIDGNNVKTFAANDIFLGITIPNGRHDIEFRYETPGLKIGIIVSMSTVICLLIICIVERKRYAQKGSPVC